MKKIIIGTCALLSFLLLFCLILLCCIDDSEFEESPTVYYNRPIYHADTKWTCPEVDISFMVDSNREAVGSYEGEDGTEYLYFDFRRNSYEVYGIPKPEASSYWPTGAFERVLNGNVEYTENQCILYIEKENNYLWQQEEDVITLTFSSTQLPEGTVDLGGISPQSTSKMWVIFAFGAAFLAGLTPILIKCGVKKTDSNVAAAMQTAVVLVFSWVVALRMDSIGAIGSISGKSWLILILAGLAVGAAGLCYFRALKLGDVNQVVPIGKSSTIFTILMALIFLWEGIDGSKFASMLLIAAGIFLMTRKKKDAETSEKESRTWILYAVLSAVFLCLATIFWKINSSEVDIVLCIAIPISVALVMAWIVVFVTEKQNTILQIDKKELAFICISGLTLGASLLCFNHAFSSSSWPEMSEAISMLSVFVTIALSSIVLEEDLSKKAVLGLILIYVGTVPAEVLHDVGYILLLIIVIIINGIQAL